MNKLINTVAAIALSVSAFAPAAVQAREESNSVRVSYADLDLNSAAGQKALNSRIKHAVDTVCGRSNGALDLNQVRIFEKCRTQSMQTVTASIASKLPVSVATR